MHLLSYRVDILFLGHCLGEHVQGIVAVYARWWSVTILMSLLFGRSTDWSFLLSMGFSVFSASAIFLPLPKSFSEHLLSSFHVRTTFRPRYNFSPVLLSAEYSISGCSVHFLFYQSWRFLLLYSLLSLHHVFNLLPLNHPKTRTYPPAILLRI